MAQLSDDCFAFGGPMMSVDEAVGIIAARVTAVQEVETVALTEADGRILANGISAYLPLPPFTNSAVDGYAVRRGDLPDHEEAAFPVTGRVQAGAAARGAPGDTSSLPVENTATRMRLRTSTWVRPNAAMSATSCGRSRWPALSAL